MAKYLKEFSTQSEYNDYINSQDALFPNVSYCTDGFRVFYSPIDYSKRYLRTVALEDGTISFNIWRTMGTDYITSISYSLDNGGTWVTTENEDDKESNLSITVNVNEGDSILWKGDAQQTGYFDDDEGECVGSFFSSTARFNIDGNVMSLCYGDNFISEDELEYEGQFACLFYDYDGELTCDVVNANNLALSATTLSNQCYASMFQGCSSLETAPELPATTLADGCYSFMFSRCTSLVTAPELPATTLALSCYFNMFYGCTSLVTAPELPATTLANGCYYAMFHRCTSLVTAPELPATTLANGCYRGMFENCTSLVTVSELPATTLAERCYVSMFSGCTSLASAPELPATTLALSCYGGMFNGCTSLNYIKAMFTTTPSGIYTQEWVQGVAASGTFVKNSAATWNVTGVNGVPSGWTVNTEDPD